MQLPAILERLCRAGLRRVRLLVIGAVTILLTAHLAIQPASLAQIGLQFGRAPAAEQDSFAGVYLPTDRAISRALERSRERLKEGEYHEALAFLHGLLGREEDWFLERGDTAGAQLGVKATARQLIGKLPPEGQEAYELLHGAAARRQFEAALTSGDRKSIAAVVRQFFHTKAGYEAALVLAQIEADQGHRLAAAQLYRELLDSPRAAKQFEPQLSLLAALNQLAAGERDAASKTMRSLVERYPAAQLVLAGNTELVPGEDADHIEWLLEIVGQPSHAKSHDQDWLLARGRASRNRTTVGGPPHLRARWQARYINDPNTESYLTARSDDFAQRSIVVIPMAQPIAAGDVAIMRTPDNIVAVDWQTGKRIWETREDADLNTDERTSEFIGDIDREQWAAQGNPLEMRMWDDSLAMSLSSDGQRVFLLRGIPANDTQQAMAFALGPNFSPMGDGNGATNQLAAYDIATQGKLVWELDGSRAAAPLDGAFFLGVPLAIDNTLYVIAEIRSAIYLLALEPATGKLLWQQQLLGLEQSISLDPLRRRSGASPSYDAGILVCPTAAGAVIAIDVVKREFAWVYRYSREPQSPAEYRNMFQNNAQSPTVRANDRWLDSTALIADGHVFVTPAESNELHCVDLQSGKLIWKHRQGDSLFIGAVDDGHLLLVGAENVQALRVDDGSSAWSQELAALPAGSIPAGQGYLSNGSYYLPLTSGDIAEVEIKSGRITTHTSNKPGAKLGNLICHRGSVLSQSSLTLDKFEQLDVLKNRTELALAANPEDPTALRELAELRKTEGRNAEAVTLLKRAYKQSPTDGLISEMLAESLLEALSDDYDMYKYDAPLIAKLVRDRQQQIELLRVEARGLDKLGQRLPAFDAYLRLADLTAEEPAELRISSHHTVRSDAWISARLAAIWEAATADERSEMGRRLDSRRPEAKHARTTAELRHYLAHLDQLPGSAEIRVALVKYLVDRDRLQEAEIERLKLEASSDDASRALAEKLRTELVKKPTREILSEGSGDWPRGVVKSELVPAAPAENEPQGNRGAPDRMAGYRQLRIEQASPGDANSFVQWYVAMDCSEIVGRNPLGDDLFHLPIEQNNRVKPYRDSSLAHAAQLGRLLFVAIGGRVIAINTPGSGSEGAPDMLWQTDPMNRYTTNSQSSPRAASEQQASRANRRPVYHSWSPRKRIIGSLSPGVYSLGPVTPRGVVYQELDQIKCVDPLNGEIIWTRSDIPPGCELFGDSEFVCAADVSARKAYVFRMVDGRRVGDRDLPKFEWLLTAGRNVAEIGFEMNGQDRALIIRVSDIVSQETLFEHKYALASRITVVEPGAVGVYEPTGKFQLIDVRTGQTLLDRPLDAVADCNGIHALPSGDQLFLFVSSPPNQQFKPLMQQSDFPLINGRVYAFDTQSGKLVWPEPAIVRNRGIVLSQPRDIPFLVFADRKLVRDAKTGGGSQLRVLCIDKQTGHSVYSNDELTDTSINRFRIRGEQAGDPTVVIEMSANRIVLNLTDDQPSGPQTVANDDTAPKPEKEEPGLGGLGRRITGAIQEALEESAGGTRNSAATLPPGSDDD